jgi:two-component system alkaline phosphatase synthesis response regulator PhoP
MAIIYYVEDDQSIGFVIEKTIEHAGYTGVGFQQGDAFLTAFQKKKPDMVLLDIMLPDGSGLDLLKNIRKKDHDIPIMMISALQSEMDKVIALDLGADDYLTKPFGVLELASRIQAKIRKQAKPSLCQVGDVVIDDDKHACFIGEEPTHLTNKEYLLLRLLMQGANRVVPKQTIFTEVWGTDYIGETRTLDMHIRSLRKALAQSSRKVTIRTIRGIGYQLQ